MPYTVVGRPRAKQTCELAAPARMGLCVPHKNLRPHLEGAAEGRQAPGKGPEIRGLSEGVLYVPFNTRGEMWENRGTNPW